MNRIVFIGALAKAVKILSIDLDPETGLAPCGCSGKAKHIHQITPSGDYAVKCGKCKIMTDWYNSKESAMNAWNTARGYREDEE